MTNPNEPRFRSIRVSFKQEDRMKKYLQACESGGSIYGKNRRTAGPDLSGDMGRRQGEQMTNYRAFYKSQLDALHKVFKRDK